MKTKSQMLQRFLLITAGIAVLAGVGYCVHHNQILEDKKKAEHAAALAVAELPLGTESAWMQYIDRRIAVSIQRDGEVVRITEMIDYVLSGVTYVSQNTPYTVSCSILGITVTFGYGEDAATVMLQGIVPDPNIEKPPPLGVHESSAAAKALRERICAHVATAVGQILN